MPRYVLIRKPWAWWLIDNEGKPSMTEDMIGNIRDVQLLRDGPDVLITSDTLGCTKSIIIPYDTIIKGFGAERDGQALRDVTDTGAIYNSALREVA